MEQNPGSKLSGNDAATLLQELWQENHKDSQASEFIRRQIQDNLPVVSRAASEVLGRPVRAQIAGSASPAPPASDASSPAPKRELTVEELARREPAIQSFIDLFPGPVKVEEIDS